MRELGDRVEGVSRRDGLGHHARGLVRVGREILLEGEAGDEGLGLVEVDGRPLVDDDLLLARVLRGLLLLGLQLPASRASWSGLHYERPQPGPGRNGRRSPGSPRPDESPSSCSAGWGQTNLPRSGPRIFFTLLQNGPEILAQNG